METIGAQRLYSYYEDQPKPVKAANRAIREGNGHEVFSYLDLAKKVAELQFLNRDYVLLFRGQEDDHRINNRTTLKPSLFRPEPGRTGTRESLLRRRYETLANAVDRLIRLYRYSHVERLRRQRILQWSILQHYEICDTPLLDVTQSLRIAASFASLQNSATGYLYVLGVPNISGAITASAEAGIQIVRLASVCPPEAVRPHVQEGYLLGEYPDIPDFDQKKKYHQYEIDFGRRLLAKFRFNPHTFWSGANYTRVQEEALRPTDVDDEFCRFARRVRRPSTNPAGL